IEGDRQFAAARPVVRLTASHVVDAGVVAGACAFHERRADGGAGSAVRAMLAHVTSTSPSDDEFARTSSSRVVALTPVKALRPATDYLFRCGPALVPAGGTMGLAKPHDEAFTTHGAAGVKKVSPAGYDVAADGVKVV